MKASQTGFAIVFKSLFVLILALSLNGATSEIATAKPSETMRKSANRKNLQWDLNIKEQSYHGTMEYLRRKKVSINKNKQMVAKLKRIMNRLKAQSLIPDLPYEVHLVDLPIVNANCYPGGGIVFYQGIFDPQKGLIDPKNENEIAAVMGHEIAHATLRHAYHKQKTDKALSILGSVGSVAVGSTAGKNWSTLFDTVYDISTQIYFPSYSRKHESEADVEGLIIMVKAGYDPESAIAVWTRAAQKHGSNTNIYASHSSNGKRAKALRNHLNNIQQNKVKNL